VGSAHGGAANHSPPTASRLPVWPPGARQ
jgi:hypothetical protein